MTFDPYEVLGVSRDADARHIKAAYYARARATHPDISRTTDAKPFQDAVRAFGILSDAERRKRFDETGAVDDVDLAKERGAAMEILANMFERVIDAARKPLKSVDFIQELKALVDMNIEDTQQTQIGLTNKINERLELRGRITRQNDGHNLFEERLTKQIGDLQNGLEMQRIRLRILSVARAEVGNYRNEVELVAAFQMVQFGYSFGGSSSGNGWTLTRTGTS